jgi:nicotinate-nucleotide pyrophosphorylase (carboxylating)
MQTGSIVMDKHVKSLIALALAEDVGQGDITSQLLIPEKTQAKLIFVARQPMVVCGVAVVAAVFEMLGGGVHVATHVEDGQRVDAGAHLVTLTGAARILLTGERTALNLMQRMSGVATLTKAYVQQLVGTKAVLLDTRKTMPGMRALDKYAVKMGGGQNHRMRLDDMVLIKDNHIALCGGVEEAVRKAKAETSLPVVVECDTLEQVREAIEAASTRILLDNMSIAQMKEAVAMSAGRVALEVSGGVSLEAMGNIARTGVDYISVGRLTHSAPVVDIGADISFS